jgi:alpha-galactosidase
MLSQVLAIARALVAEGFAAAGYTFVNLDDAWSSPMRSSSGRLQGDIKRFPNGIKWLADHLHGMGLKLGL